MLGLPAPKMLAALDAHTRMASQPKTLSLSVNSLFRSDPLAALVQNHVALSRKKAAEVSASRPQVSRWVLVFRSRPSGGGGRGQEAHRRRGSDQAILRRPSGQGRLKLQNSGYLCNLR
jgi:hypothetical protein